MSPEDQLAQDTQKISDMIQSLYEGDDLIKASLETIDPSNVNNLDIHKQSLLMATTAYGSIDSITILMNHLFERPLPLPGKHSTVETDLRITGHCNQTIFMCAAAHGRFEALETFLIYLDSDKLMQWIEEKDDFGNTALDYAVSYGHKDCAIILLQYHHNGSHITTTTNTFFRSLSYWLSRLWLEIRVNFSQFMLHMTPNQTKIQLAIQFASYGIVKSLLQDNEIQLSVNALHIMGVPILHYACKYGWEDIIIRLLQCPAFQVNNRDVLGNTALHYAAESSNTSIIKLLLKDNSINVNAINHLGQTPLHKASAAVLVESIKTLIEDPTIQINIQDKFGKTALFYSGCRFHETGSQLCVPIIKLLLEYGIDIELVDKYGKKANDYCRSGDNTLDFANMRSHVLAKDSFGLMPLKKERDPASSDGELTARTISVLSDNNDSPEQSENELENVKKCV